MDVSTLIRAIEASRDGHFWSIVAHIIQGFVAGLLMALGLLFWPLLAIGLAILWANERYQWFGFQVNSDTLKRDWRDYIWGLYPGLCVGGIIDLLVVLL